MKSWRLCSVLLAIVVDGAFCASLPKWPEPTMESKPWAYNWWMGSAVDAKGLEHQCREMASKGFGGFHVIPIYGARGWEGKYREYLSESWIEGWNMAVRMARRYGLGVDLTMGSGWCFGGPWVTKEDACSSGMKVKRAGPGGRGYMADPFSATAISNFIARFEPFFGKNAKGVERPRAFHQESYEYFNAKPKRAGDWSAMQLDAFKVWTDWCRSNGYLTRYQAHGSPGNWLDLYSLSDMPETEMFAHDCRNILVSKFASSSAHVTGRKYVTSESCTWLNEHFNETLAEFKTFLDRLFLSGVNHIFYHGLCYSPVDVAWPGWCFYASSQMNPRNPIWRDAGLLNDYVMRCQSMFQSCVPDEDTLLYWPHGDSAAVMIPQKAHMGTMSVHNAGEWFDSMPIGEAARRLAADGVQFDYVSDFQLRTLDLSRYARVVVPDGANIPKETAAAIAAFKGSRAAKSEPFASIGFSATRFRRDGETVYFIANTNGVRIAARVIPSAHGKTAALMNPMTGSVKFADWKEGEGFEISLEPGESVFLAVRNNSSAQVRSAKRSVIRGRKVSLAGPWTLTPVEGGPELPPVRTMRKLSTWSRNEDGSENPFCGTMRYSSRFDFKSEGMTEVEFDFGDVRQSMRVEINGQPAGFAIMPPYRVTIPSSMLKSKDNILEVEVTSVGANRIRHNDRTGVKWKYFHDANMITYGYKGPLDASNWPLADCGLLGPVTYTEK